MLKRILAFFFRCILRLRYRVRLVGLESVPEGDSGFLMVPNHPALIDPVILTAFLWPRFKLRPLVLEKYYYMPGVQWILKLVRAIPMPDMEVDGGFYKRRRVSQAMEAVNQALRSGDNILMYPSGRLMTSGHERLGGNSGLYNILKQNPKVRVLALRTRGLYGSMFSKAWTGGKSPDLAGSTLQALGKLCLNLFFFSPRRAVTLEIAHASSALYDASNVSSVNRELEKWFNDGASLEPRYVPYLRWFPEKPPVAKPQKDLELVGHAPPELTEKIITRLSQLSGIPEIELKPSMRLGDDLGLDSLMIAEFVTWLEEECHAGDIDLPDLTTVGSAIHLASGGASHKLFEIPETPAFWLKDLKSRISPDLPKEGATLIECFLRCASRQIAGKQIAIADERSGILTWRQLLLSATALSSAVKKLEGEKVGIMLPASVASCVVFAAALLSRKVPVMLNWTVGRKNLEHAIAVSGLSKVITSSAFLDRVQSDLGESIEGRFLFLENLKEKLNLGVKLKAAAFARLPVRAQILLLDLKKVSPQQTAVILFTSGSEASPKGVPLSHANLLSNLSSALDVVKLQPHDVFYGFLPPFHSFGLLLCTLLPLLAGVKSALYPDPNESRKIAAGCGKWKITLTAGTPGFLRSVVRVGPTEAFANIRLLISGADKMLPDLPALVCDKAPKAELIEGYGITECSPIVTANRPGEKHIGVGRPIRGVELMIVHHVSHEPLPAGEMGLVLVSGASVFNGYLNEAGNPFLAVNGRNWYNSGDLGYIEEGSLVLSGRLKRFVKIGGEMVSLPAIEEAISKRWPQINEAPEHAVISREVDGRPELHLFTTRSEITIESANEAIKAAGLTPLYRLTGVAVLDTMPVLGSGKVDIQNLMKST